MVERISDELRVNIAAVLEAGRRMAGYLESNIANLNEDEVDDKLLGWGLEVWSLKRQLERDTGDTNDSDRENL